MCFSFLTHELKVLDLHDFIISIGYHSVSVLLLLVSICKTTVCCLTVDKLLFFDHLYGKNGVYPRHCLPTNP